MTRAIPRREEIPDADRWNVESVFPSEEAFAQALAQLEAEYPSLAVFQGTLGTSAGQLLAALAQREELQSRLDRVMLYASMLLNGDEADQTHQARAGTARGLAARFAATAAFIEPELLAVPDPVLDRFLGEDPALAVYRHYLETLRLLRDHVRSSEVEATLALASEVLDASWHIHSALENADMTFATIAGERDEMVSLAQGNSEALIASPRRSVRKAAWQAYADGYLALKHTMAATLAGAVKRDVFYARVLRYGSALEASLSPHHLPRAVFDALIGTGRAQLPIWHRYWSIRRRALGVARLQPYDLQVPLADAEKSIAYDQAVELILEGLVPLGPEYSEVARRGLTVERWVDKYPNQGKGSGAFSSGVHGTYPFIMQNYDGSLLSLSVLAHELGHSMHSYYTWREQPRIYAHYSMFVAETASNFNQALVRAHLLAADSDRRWQIAVIEEALSNFHRYLFIMPLLAQFESDAHQKVERGEALTADTLSDKLVQLYTEGFGDEVAMDEPRVGIIWAQFPHLFANFYVWQYATGISAATALAEGVLTEGRPAAERYLQFLQAGSSVFPLDALLLAGIDMTRPEPVVRAYEVLGGLIDRLDALVGEGPLPWLPEPDC